MPARGNNKLIKRALLAASIFLLAAALQACSSHTEPALSHFPPPQERELSKPPSGKRKIIITHAVRSIGMTYSWGGTSPETGFDCSGLIVYTHRKARISTPRTAKDLYNRGKIVSRNELNPADLVFFKHPQSGKTLHVGIYIGDNTFIHAPGKGRQVTYASLDNPYFRRYYLGSRTYL